MIVDVCLSVFRMLRAERDSEAAELVGDVPLLSGYLDNGLLDARRLAQGSSS